MHITVLTGGTSSERDVALASAVQVVGRAPVAGATRSRWWTPRGVTSPQADESRLLSGTVGIAPPSIEELHALERGLLLSGLGNLPVVRDADVLFLALHGGRGEDGTIQTLLEVVGVPYTGSGRLGSAMAMDKDVSKRLFRAAGVPTADWVMAPASRAEVAARLRVAGGGQAVQAGVDGRSDRGEGALEDYEEAVELAGRYDDEVMIERFVPGRELTVGILEGRGPGGRGDHPPA